MYREYLKDCQTREYPKHSVEWAYKELPGFMDQDTREGKKENYNAIRDSYKEVDRLYYESGEQRLLGKAGLYLAGLMDTMSAMAQEIFEHYKYFESLYKRALKEILAEDLKAFEEDPAGAFLLSYAILKGCRMKAILSEKYLALGEALYEAAVKKASEEGVSESEEMKKAGEEYRMGRNQHAV